MSRTFRFGTDGIRGVANQFPMTAEVALQLGRAAGHVFRVDDRRHRIVIGKDTRLSGYMIENALVAGLTSMGVDALVVGPMPTPAIALLTRSMRADAGVMISASHNPYEDNGIKFFGPTGFKLPDETEREIERLVQSDDLEDMRPTAEGIGRAQRIEGASHRYVEFVKGTIPRGMTFEGLRVVVDCAHGAAYRVAPEVLTELGAQIIAINVDPSGTNINADCGAVYPAGMCAAVREHGADIGVAFDGDADRMICCDHEGRIVDGDVVMTMCALHMAERNALNGNTVVCTVMSNMGMQLALRERGIHVLRTQVGDRYVVEAMREGGYSLGGEQSGHIIFLEHNTTGDGLITALQVLSLMREQDQPLARLADVFEPVPQELLSVRVAERVPFAELDTVSAVMDEVTSALGDDGRLLVRYSGTELKARVLVEGREPGTIRAMAAKVAHSIADALDGAVDE